MRYPKLATLLITIITAYILFQAHFFQEFAKTLNAHGCGDTKGMEFEVHRKKVKE